MPSRSRRKRRFPLVVFAALALCAAAVWFTRIPAPGPADAPPARLLIPVGATFHAAADSLAASGLIRWSRLFTLYGKLRGKSRTIHAGTYRLARGQTWTALIDALHTGKGVVATITIREGWAIRKIVSYLSKELAIPAESLDAAVRDSAMLARVGDPAETLEGYLFPDTYVIALGTTARQAVALMVTNFERNWKPEWNERLDTLKRTRHEILTLASIVETEVERGEERPIVSAVYWNRLHADMPLQADPTVLYALGRPMSRVYYRDLEVDSPYNTYKRVGLPPGPIASPGSAAIVAALWPAQVPYRYFVATPDGHHEFRRTYEEHEAAVLKLRASARADSVRRARGDTSAHHGAPGASPSPGRGGA